MRGCTARPVLAVLDWLTLHAPVADTFLQGDSRLEQQTDADARSPVPPGAERWFVQSAETRRTGIALASEGVDMLVTVNVVLLLAVVVLGYLLVEGPRRVEPVEIIKVVAAGPAVSPGTD